MRSRIVLSIVMALLSLPLMAQTNLLEEKQDSVINIIAYFCKNDTMTYTANEIEYKVEKGDTTIIYDIETDYQLIVRDSTENGYTIELTTTDLRIGEVEDSIHLAMYEGLWELSKGMRCIFTTDEFGTIQNIKNWREIRNTMKESVKFVTNKMFAMHDGLDSLFSRERFESMLSMTFSTEDNIRKEVFSELGMLFGAHGRSWNIGTTENDEIENGFPNHYVIKVGYTTTEEETDIEGDYAIWANTVTKVPIDDVMDLALDYTTMAMTDKASDIVGENKQKIIEEIKKQAKEVEINSREYYSFFFNGWPKECSTQKTTTIGTQNKTKATYIIWSSRSWNNY